MKIMRSFSLLAMATLLYVRCGEKKKEPTEVANEAMEVIKEAVDPFWRIPIL
jgi:hypothetical protein